MQNIIFLFLCVFFSQVCSNRDSEGTFVDRFSQINQCISGKKCKQAENNGHDGECTSKLYIKLFEFDIPDDIRTLCTAPLMNKLDTIVAVCKKSSEIEINKRNEAIQNIMLNPAGIPYSYMMNAFWQTVRGHTIIDFQDINYQSKLDAIVFALQKKILISVQEQDSNVSENNHLEDNLTKEYNNMVNLVWNENKNGAFFIKQCVMMPALDNQFRSAPVLCFKDKAITPLSMPHIRDTLHTEARKNYCSMYEALNQIKNIQDHNKLCIVASEKSLNKFYCSVKTESCRKKVWWWESQQKNGDELLPFTKFFYDVSENFIDSYAGAVSGLSVLKHAFVKEGCKIEDAIQETQQARCNELGQVSDLASSEEMYVDECKHMDPNNTVLIELIQQVFQSMFLPIFFYDRFPSENHNFKSTEEIWKAFGETGLPDYEYSCFENRLSSIGWRFNGGSDLRSVFKRHGKLEEEEVLKTDISHRLKQLIDRYCRIKNDKIDKELDDDFNKHYLNSRYFENFLKRDNNTPKAQYLQDTVDAMISVVTSSMRSEESRMAYNADSILFKTDLARIALSQNLIPEMPYDVGYSLSMSLFAMNNLLFLQEILEHVEFNNGTAWEPQYTTISPSFQAQLSSLRKIVEKQIEVFRNILQSYFVGVDGMVNTNSLISLAVSNTLKDAEEKFIFGLKEFFRIESNYMKKSEVEKTQEHDGNQAEVENKIEEYYSNESEVEKTQEHDGNQAEVENKIESDFDACINRIYIIPKNMDHYKKSEYIEIGTLLPGNASTLRDYPYVLSREINQVLYPGGDNIIELHRQALMRDTISDMIKFDVSKKFHIIYNKKDNDLTINHFSIEADTKNTFIDNSVVLLLNRDQIESSMKYDDKFKHKSVVSATLLQQVRDHATILPKISIDVEAWKMHEHVRSVEAHLEVLKNSAHFDKQIDEYINKCNKIVTTVETCKTKIKKYKTTQDVNSSYGINYDNSKKIQKIWLFEINDILKNINKNLEKKCYSAAYSYFRSFERLGKKIDNLMNCLNNIENQQLECRNLSGDSYLFCVIDFIFGSGHNSAKQSALYNHFGDAAIYLFSVMLNDKSSWYYRKSLDSAIDALDESALKKTISDNRQDQRYKNIVQEQAEWSSYCENPSLLNQQKDLDVLFNFFCSSICNSIKDLDAVDKEYFVSILLKALNNGIYRTHYESYCYSNKYQEYIKNPKGIDVKKYLQVLWDHACKKNFCHGSGDNSLSNPNNDRQQYRSCVMFLYCLVSVLDTVLIYGKLPGDSKTQETEKKLKAIMTIFQNYIIASNKFCDSDFSTANLPQVPLLDISTIVGHVDQFNLKNSLVTRIKILFGSIEKNSKFTVDLNDQELLWLDKDNRENMVTYCNAFCNYDLSGLSNVYEVPEEIEDIQPEVPTIEEGKEEQKNEIIIEQSINGQEEVEKQIIVPEQIKSVINEVSLDSKIQPITEQLEEEIANTEQKQPEPVVRTKEFELNETEQEGTKTIDKAINFLRVYMPWMIGGSIFIGGCVMCCWLYEYIRNYLSTIKITS
jgi:hypothetical protein